MLNRFAIAALLACLFVAQFHVWVDLDPCLWNPNTSHRTGNHSNGHNCQGCLAGNWVMAHAAPSVAAPAAMSRFESPALAAFQTNYFLEVSSPRAPPLA